MPNEHPSTENTWRIVRRELSEAPLRTRRMLLFSFLSLDLGIAATVYDMVTGTNPPEIHRLASIFLALFGAAFLIVAQVLHQLTQGRECQTFSMGRQDSQRFHRALVAVPLLSMIAVIMMAVALGILASAL